MRKKIVFFSSKDLSNVGGGERVLSVLSNGLQERYDIIVVTPYVTESYFKFGEGIEIRSLGLVKPHNSLKRKIQLLQVIVRINYYFRRESFDFFVASTFMAVILTSLASWKKRKNLIAWIHTSYYQKEPLFLKSFFLHTLYKFIVISINTMDVDNYKKYSKRVYLLQNPLSFHTKKKSKLEAKRLISVGRLYKDKGFDCLIKICANVFHQKNDWVLDIYGQDDGEKQKLLELIKQNGMEGRIRIFSPTNIIHEEMINSSIFVFCSLIESFGLVLLEACECGLPCIAYNSPSGIKDIVKDGYNGYLVEPYDDIIFENRLVNLIEDEDLRIKMGKNASQFASNFSDTRILQQWYDLIG